MYHKRNRVRLDREFINSVGVRSILIVDAVFGKSKGSLNDNKGFDRDVSYCAGLIIRKICEDEEDEVDMCADSVVLGKDFTVLSLDSLIMVLSFCVLTGPTVVGFDEGTVPKDDRVDVLLVWRIGFVILSMVNFSKSSATDPNGVVSVVVYVKLSFVWYGIEDTFSTAVDDGTKERRCSEKGKPFLSSSLVRFLAVVFLTDGMNGGGIIRTDEGTKWYTGTLPLWREGRRRFVVVVELLLLLLSNDDEDDGIAMDLGPRWYKRIP